MKCGVIGLATAMALAAPVAASTRAAGRMLVWAPNDDLLKTQQFC